MLHTCHGIQMLHPIQAPVSTYPIPVNDSEMPVDISPDFRASLFPFFVAGMKGIGVSGMYCHELEYRGIYALRDGSPLPDPDLPLKSSTDTGNFSSRRSEYLPIVRR
jgi:hypothetical protein